MFFLICNHDCIWGYSAQRYSKTRKKSNLFKLFSAPTARAEPLAKICAYLCPSVGDIYFCGKQGAEGGESARTCARFCARFLGLTAMVLSEIGVHLCTVGVAYIFLILSWAFLSRRGFVFPTDGQGWTRIFDYAFGFVLLWDPKGSVVATDANAPRRRSARVCLRGENLIARRCRGFTQRSFSRSFCRTQNSQNTQKRTRGACAGLRGENFIARGCRGLSRKSITEWFIFTTNGHGFTGINASFGLRQGIKTFLRGDAFSSPRWFILVSAEKIYRH